MSERRTESLLNELPRDLEPVKPIPRLRTLVLVALAAFALALAADGLLGHPLPVLADGVAWADPGFLAVLAGLLLTSAGAIVAALAAAVPGREQAARAGSGAAAAGFAVAAVAAVWGVLQSGGEAGGGLFPGVQCASRASLLGVVPAIVLCAFLALACERRPLLGAGAAAVGALALGAAAVHASCVQGDALHVLLGHWLTPLAVALVLAAPLSLVVRRLSRRS